MPSPPDLCKNHYKGHAESWPLCSGIQGRGGPVAVILFCILAEDILGAGGGDIYLLLGSSWRLKNQRRTTTGANCSLGMMGTSTSSPEMAGWLETPLESLEMPKTSMSCFWLAGGLVTCPGSHAVPEGSSLLSHATQGSRQGPGSQLSLQLATRRPGQATAAHQSEENSTIAWEGLL